MLETVFVVIYRNSVQYLPFDCAVICAVPSSSLDSCLLFVATRERRFLFSVDSVFNMVDIAKKTKQEKIE